MMYTWGTPPPLQSFTMSSLVVEYILKSPKGKPKMQTYVENLDSKTKPQS